MSARRYDENGFRLTDCCGAKATFADDGALCCKTCWEEVPFGQGDGSERLVESLPEDKHTRR